MLLLKVIAISLVLGFVEAGAIVGGVYLCNRIFGWPCLEDKGVVKPHRFSNRRDVRDEIKRAAQD